MPKRSKRPTRQPVRKRTAPRPKKPDAEPAPPEAPACFISHANKDFNFAYRLETMLAKHGVDAWYAARNLLGSQDWYDEIGDALRRCNCFIVILSPHALKSDWVDAELKYALRQPGGKKRIVPVLYRNCDYLDRWWTLAPIQQIDFRDDFHAGCEQLLRIWGIEYQRP